MNNSLRRASALTVGVLLLGVLSVATQAVPAQATPTRFVSSNGIGDGGSCSAPGYNTIQAALDDTSTPSGDTVIVCAGTYDLASQLNITKSVSIVGQGDVTLKSANTTWDTTNGGKYIVGIYAGDSASPVSISNVTLDSNSQSYGVNTYGNAYGVLTGVTIQNSKGAGLTVNGSTIIATALNTSGNHWGAVNVDPGSAATTPSVFTLNSGALAESNQIWSDGAHVNGSATVTVSATGYNQYALVDRGLSFFIWTNNGLTNAVINTKAPTVVYSTIQSAINAAIAGDTINIAAGTYSANLTIDKAVTIVGAGQANTIIYPGISAPTGTSYVMTIKADNVIIHDLTVDGDNPSLTSGIVVGGADINAARGIVSDPTQNHGNIEIYNTTIKNIYLRGIQLGNSGVPVFAPFTINIHDNTVTNVQGDANASVAVFNAGGSGTIAHNIVSGTPDAINANHSQGTQFLNNTVTNSASGIHTDNAGDRAGSVADLIAGNAISNGNGSGVGDSTGSYGIWVLAPYIAPTVQNNTVSNVKNGLAVFGSGIAVTPIFSNNAIDGSSIPGSIGALITTDMLGFGSGNVSAILHNNKLVNVTYGVTATQQFTYTSTVNATTNWWGSTNPNFESLIVGVGAVARAPWCTDVACSTLSDDADLVSLSLSDGTLSPVFNSSTTSYSASVGNGTTTVTVSESTTPGANALVTGEGNLNVGDNPIMIGVTSTDGTATKLYTITVSRAAPVFTPPPPSPSDEDKAKADADSKAKAAAEAAAQAEAAAEAAAQAEAAAEAAAQAEAAAEAASRTAVLSPDMTTTIDASTRVSTVTNTGSIVTQRGTLDVANFTLPAVIIPSGTTPLDGTTPANAPPSGTTTTTAETTVDLSQPQDVGGGIMVTVEKAVIVASSSPGEPITLTNTTVANVSVNIPDGTTVLAPASWDGKINPPSVGNSTGTPPSGFSVGSQVVEVGSSSAVLLFDRPASVVLTGVTGPVGYRPSGSTTWISITPCGPAGPVFPSACSQTDGTNTTILTYHFTSFAALTVAPDDTPVLEAWVAKTPVAKTMKMTVRISGSGAFRSIKATLGVLYANKRVTIEMRRYGSKKFNKLVVVKLNKAGTVQTRQHLYATSTIRVLVNGKVLVTRPFLR
jgi:hypothetical protein